MHRLHHIRRIFSTCLQIGSCALFLLSPTIAAENETTEFENSGIKTPLSVRIDSGIVTQLECQLTIKGKLTTPAANRVRQWDLDSKADFRFVQRQLPSELSGPLALQAIRQYSQASVNTRVGKDHQTKTALPQANSLILVRGTNVGLSVAAVAHPLSRGQFDLLLMPGDPLPCSSLLPSRDVAIGEKWDTDAWVLPRLTGLDAVINHSLSCQLKSLDGDVALIHFIGKAEGAVHGSTSAVELTGTLTLNTRSRLLTELKCQMKEKRSAGPVSAGLDASVNIVWTQSIIDMAKIPTVFNETLFDRPLALQTPWRLSFHHSPEWHIFNQTSRVLMLRQIRNGALISQCNVSAGVVMPPGQHTPDPDFRGDVETAIHPRAGQIIAEDTIRTDNEWRIRHIQALGSISDVEIIWDYYLCTAASGDQFSLLFSHSTKNTKSFADEPNRLLSSFSLARRRPVLPPR